MKALRKVQKYLKACGIGSSDASDYDLSTEFPMAIASRYDAMYLRILEEPRIVIEPKAEVPPDELVDAVGQVAELHRPVVALDFADCEYSNLLKKAGVDYIVPGRQVFLPPYATLSPPEAYERAERAFLREFLSPWAQVVLFRILLFHAEEKSVSYAALREELRLRDVYLTRACQELEHHRLAALDKEGRNRLVSFSENRRLLWQTAQKRLRTPILKRIRYADSLTNFPKAGCSALEVTSELAPSGEVSVAMAQSDIKKLNADKIRRYSGTEIEVWRYDPCLLSRNELVDPLSLYMSLKESPDARIQIAIESLLEKTL